MILIITGVSISTEHSWASDFEDLIYKSAPIYRLLDMITSTTVALYQMYFLTRGDIQESDSITYQKSSNLIGELVRKSYEQTKELISIDRAMEALHLPLIPNSSITTSSLLVSGGVSNFESSISSAIELFFGNSRPLANLSEKVTGLTTPFGSPNPTNRRFYFATVNTIKAYRNSLNYMGTFLTDQAVDSLNFRGYFEYISIPLVLLLTAVFLLFRLGQVLGVQKKVVEIILLLKTEELERLVANTQKYVQQIDEFSQSLFSKSKSFKDIMGENQSPPKMLENNQPKSGQAIEIAEIDVLASTDRKLLQSKRGIEKNQAEEDNESRLAPNPATSNFQASRKLNKKKTLSPPANEKEFLELEEKGEDFDGLPNSSENKKALAVQSKIITRRLFIGFLWKISVLLLVCLALVFTRLGLETTHCSQARSTLKLMGSLFKIDSDLKIAESILYSEAHKAAIGKLQINRPFGCLNSKHTLYRQREFSVSNHSQLLIKYEQTFLIHFRCFKTILRPRSI